MGIVCIIGSYLKALVMTTDRIPVAGETLTGRDYRGTYGGKGSDMAVQSARLGANTSFIGVIGDDLFGKEFVALCEDEGIDISGLRITRELPTGTGFIIKDTNGRNVITIASGANELFSRDDIDRNIKKIEEADVILAQLEIPLDTALYAMKVGKKLKKITLLNPAPAISLIDTDLSDVDILTPNETEARITAGLTVGSDKSDREIADMLLQTGCGRVIMTLGDRGAGVFERGMTEEIRPYRIRVIDSNGAGDCFNASLAAALSMGRDFSESVALANAAAALCCTKWETVPSYHRLEDVEAFREKRGY